MTETRARRLTVLQHVSFEGPAAIGDWAEARGHRMVREALYGGEPAPAPGSVDALVVMGGPMGVGEEGRFPFLRDEKRLLRACLDAGRPILGVCLGAQLLADVLGARVTAQGYREIGWFPVPTKASRVLAALLEPAGRSNDPWRRRAAPTGYSKNADTPTTCSLPRRRRDRPAAARQGQPCYRAHARRSELPTCPGFGERPASGAWAGEGQS